MPRKDGTGPEGKGPMTGRQRGNCGKKSSSATTSSVQGIGSGQGEGRGKGKGRCRKSQSDN